MKWHKEHFDRLIDDLEEDIELSELSKTIQDRAWATGNLDAIMEATRAKQEIDHVLEERWWRGCDPDERREWRV